MDNQGIKLMNDLQVLPFQMFSIGSIDYCIDHKGACYLLDIREDWKRFDPQTVKELIEESGVVRTNIFATTLDSFKDFWGVDLDESFILHGTNACVKLGNSFTGIHFVTEQGEYIPMEPNDGILWDGVVTRSRELGMMFLPEAPSEVENSDECNPNEVIIEVTQTMKFSSEREALRWLSLKGNNVGILSITIGGELI